MDAIKFPFRVKINGEYHEPNETIEVEDATEYVRQGAVIIERKAGRKQEAEEPITRRTRRRD